MDKIWHKYSASIHQAAVIGDRKCTLDKGWNALIKLLIIDDETTTLLLQ